MKAQLFHLPQRNWGTASQHLGVEIVDVFAAQRANIQQLNDGNKMNIPQQGHHAAQIANIHGFQPMICPEQEQSEDEPEQDQGKLDLNNLPDNPGNEGPQGLIQETRRGEANKGSIKSCPKSSRKKKNGH
ncbi:MAG: hypothetical protein EZS28_003407 [Streblomastix strix]|uniref:Uncharacterized protein n=1 Tax=Streblomastix strix TaxID=222440 RepID=A0A5J4X192_9EUKA|nr:MAG: hypothetical protein EZS28_003407 [Streblomastix strix]